MQGARPAEPTSKSSSRRKRILVMDDEAMIRDILRRMLVRLGHEVVVTERGEQAVARYREAFEAGLRFDAVILDLTVPGGLGGLEALQQLKAIDPEVKAIVSSGYSDDSVMADHRGHGFDSMVIKPYSSEQLAEALRSVIEQDT